MFDWDDLKYFLAVAHHGSTIAAGKALRISQSTVQRRLLELERKIRRKPVARTAAGYRLTDFGRERLPYAERSKLWSAIWNVASATWDATAAVSFA